MIRIIEKLKALGEPNRYRICMMLKNSELCVCQLLDVLGIAGGTLSRHLQVLKSAGIISTRREGKWLYYHIRDKENMDLLDMLIQKTEDKTQIEKDLAAIRPSCQIAGK